MVNPYFVAVLDGSVDEAKIRNLITKMPGVLGIDDKDSKQGKVKLAALVKQLGNDYSLDSSLMNFKSVRIMLSSSLSNESLNFLRDQVIKMSGKDKINASEVKYPEITGVMNAHPFFQFLAKAGDWGVVGVLSFLWMISYWLTYDVFRSRAYIIEKFQRKKLVAAKSIASGLGVVVLFFTAIGIWNGTLRFLDLVVLLMVLSVFWTFSMQDWKWKPTL
jgi:hypothetical protein